MTTAQVSVHENGVDHGALGNFQRWWFDEHFEHSFAIFGLDTLYPTDYFQNDHVAPEVVPRFVEAVCDYGRRILGTPPRSIVELGCGGAWFTKAFLDRGIDVMGVEGSSFGIRRAIERGVPKERLVHHDLRLPLDLGRTFDLAICTEVAEHIECPFSSQLVLNIVRHSRVVWFSFERPGTNEAHYHHCNEQPEKFWRNLFAFYDYRMQTVDPGLLPLIFYRGGYLFYSKDVPVPPEWTREEARTAEVIRGLGQLHVAPKYEPGALRWFAHKALPPFVVDLARSIKKLTSSSKRSL